MNELSLIISAKFNTISMQNKVLFECNGTATYINNKNSSDLYNHLEKGKQKTCQIEPTSSMSAFKSKATESENRTIGQWIGKLWIFNEKKKLCKVWFYRLLTIEAASVETACSASSASLLSIFLSPPPTSLLSISSYSLNQMMHLSF